MAWRYRSEPVCEKCWMLHSAPVTREEHWEAVRYYQRMCRVEDCRCRNQGHKFKSIDPVGYI